MSILHIDDIILDIIKTSGPITTKDIVEEAKKRKLKVDKEYINSLLYGIFREVVVRDRNSENVPVWRIKEKNFEAAKGYEAKLYNELIKQQIISSQEAMLDFEIRNSKNNKTYHLDIAIFRQDKKIDIEVDGFDHMRADAKLSIQKQLNNGTTEIEIDWMDNERSYVDFKEIDNTLVNKWCTKNLDWCIRYHEELLWPHDITRNIWLIEKGWKIMRLWNMQIQNDLQGSIHEIKEWITS